jgi:hypothetical protein
MKNYLPAFVIAFCLLIRPNMLSANDVIIDLVAISVDTAVDEALTTDKALTMIKSKSAQIVGQTSLRTQSQQRARIQFGATHKYAKSIIRHGKTAAIPYRCGNVPMGASLEVDPTVRANGKTIDLTAAIEFHLTDPVNPTLAEMLAATSEEEAIDQKVAPPKYTVIKRTLNFEGIQSGSLRLIKVPLPEGADAGKSYIILVRASIVPVP